MLFFVRFFYGNLFFFILYYEILILIDKSGIDFYVINFVGYFSLLINNEYDE